jgi:mannose-1-phosphate guanylyltransferase
MKIQGQELLGIWLDRLTEAGVGKILINTHYLANHVESFISSSQYKNYVSLFNEPNLLGTAGTLIANLNFYEGRDGLLIHADNYCLADFKAFKAAHNSRPNGCLITMMTFRTSNPKACGVVELDEHNVVTGFYEKVDDPPSNLANGAIYILSAEILKIMATDFPHVKDFSLDVLNNFIGQIYSYETKEIFLDIGTPETYEQANKAADREK